MKKLFVTHHAIERWIERVEPGLGYEAAEARILELWPSASRLREKTQDGAERWRIEFPFSELLIRQEPDEAIVVSCIGANEIVRQSADQGEMHDVIAETDKWPPHGEITLVVKVSWDLKGGTRTEAIDSVSRYAKRKIRELVGTGTGNAVIESVQIGNR